MITVVDVTDVVTVGVGERPMPVGLEIAFDDSTGTGLRVRTVLAVARILPRGENATASTESLNPEAVPAYRVPVRVSTRLARVWESE